jgi:hypothetical protein
MDTSRTTNVLSLKTNHAVRRFGEILAYDKTSHHIFAYIGNGTRKQGKVVKWNHNGDGLQTLIGDETHIDIKLEGLTHLKSINNNLL